MGEPDNSSQTNSFVEFWRFYLRLRFEFWGWGLGFVDFWLGMARDDFRGQIVKDSINGTGQHTCTE